MSALERFTEGDTQEARGRKAEARVTAPAARVTAPVERRLFISINAACLQRIDLPTVFSGQNGVLPATYEGCNVSAPPSALNSPFAALAVFDPSQKDEEGNAIAFIPELAAQISAAFQGGIPEGVLEIAGRLAADQSRYLKDPAIAD